MRAVIALVVIALVTGVFGMSQISQAVMSKTELTKTRLVNQMDKVDWEFISKLEGKAIDTAYVPEDKKGNVLKNSGVTIGTGVDLKMKNAEFLESIGVPSDIVEVLEPYFRLKGDEAKVYLENNPLVLSAVDIKILDGAVQKFELNKIKTAYEKDSGKSWNSLNTNQQTVVTSVGFQYGDMEKRTPNFWEGVVNGNWNGVYNELMDFGDKHDTRRETEAKRLISKI
tara:strand:- start:150 stop:827 length:678 start_codon:yes stop_codon:yes gene_type:complete